MDQNTRDILSFLVGTTLTILIITGLAVRYILVPYLRDQLITPVSETHKQVTENSHHNEQPTVMDRISDVDTAVGAVRVDVKALAHVMDEHMMWSDRWTDLWEREIQSLKARTEAPPNEQDPATQP